MDIRAGDDGAVLAVDHGDDRDEAFLTQGDAVLEVVIGDGADLGTVNVDITAFDLANELGNAVLHVDDGSVFCQQHVLFRHAGLRGQAAVGDQVAGFAVYRQYILRAKDVVAVEQLASRCVAGNVDLGHALVDDLGAQAHQAIDHAEDRVLIARDQAGGQDDGVARVDLHLVLAVGHAR